MANSDGTLTFADDLYRNTPGIFTFRANLYRDADMGGTVTGTPTTIERAWTFNTDYDTQPTKYGTWGGGSGWTGQPVYVKYTDGCGLSMGTVELQPRRIRAARMGRYDLSDGIFLTLMAVVQLAIFYFLYCLYFK